jgi:CubicO group peptidase (beta-lactamase class C family)
LRTSDHVFGPKGLLSGFALHTRPELLQNLTVKHLLTHTAGGWGNEEHDPMFHNKDRDRSVFLQRTLNEYPLQDHPGAAFHYSNFGYFLLGRVIEHVSGQPYPDYVQQHVLQPLGITDMRLGTRSPAPNEVHYSGQDHTDPYAVPIELHDANGGWIATPSDLVHFALGVFSSQDKAGAPVLFTPETLAQMTQGSPARPTYASGWAISPDLDYLHTGALDGTASFLMHRHDGLAWAIVANTRRPHSSMENDMHELSWAIARRLQL